jgi:hypothetical protein
MKLFSWQFVVYSVFLAADWKSDLFLRMMEHGLLDVALAKKVLEKKQKLLKKGTLVVSPAKGRSGSNSSSKLKKATPASKSKKASSSKKKSDEKPAKKKAKK